MKYYIEFERCGNDDCYAPTTRVTMEKDWQEKVNGSPPRVIPIIGCGSPWHYTNMEDPNVDVAR